MSHQRLETGALFIGRLSKQTRARDLEDIFYKYGTLVRCDVKYAYAFVEYEDRRDAEDAMSREDGREVLGSRIVVEPSKSGGQRGGRGGRDNERSFRGGGGDDRRYGGDRYGGDRYGGGGGRSGGGGGGYGGGYGGGRDRGGGDRFDDRYDRRRSPSPGFRRRRSPSPPRGRRY